MAGGVLADSLEVPFLQDSEQLGLQIEGNLSDFVQEDRAAVSQLKAPDAIADGSSECAARVTEELALEQFFRDRRAVDLDQWPTRSRAALVDGACNQLLSRPRFTLDENVGLGRRHQVHLAQESIQGLALPHDAVNGDNLRRLLAEVVPLQLQLLVQSLDLLKRTAIPNRHRGVRREGRQPRQHALVRARSQEAGEDAHDAAAKAQRVPQDASDIACGRPGGLDTPVVREARPTKRAAAHRSRRWPRCEMRRLGRIR